MRNLLVGLLLLSVLVAACSPEDEPLPTLARLPSITPTEAQEEQVAISTEEPSLTPAPRETDAPAETATEAETQLVTLTPIHTPSPTSDVPPTPTWTPSATITVTPSITPTDLATVDPAERPILALALTANAATVLPTDYQVPAFGGPDVSLTPGIRVISTEAEPVIVVTTASTTCPTLPPAGFGTAFQNNPDIAAQLGCPLSTTAQQLPAAWQAFEQGSMIWLNGDIFVLLDLGSSFQRYDDTFAEGVDPETSSETPPSGLQAPIRGFLKVWSSNPPVRDGLGWATSGEQGVTTTVLDFANGRMLWLPNRSEILVFIGADSGIWRSVIGSY